jgi:hypothetical protein
MYVVIEYLQRNYFDATNMTEDLPSVAKAADRMKKIFRLFFFAPLLLLFFFCRN